MLDSLALRRVGMVGAEHEDVRRVREHQPVRGSERLFGAGAQTRIGLVGAARQRQVAGDRPDEDQQQKQDEGDQHSTFPAAVAQAEARNAEAM
jgi:hypothetical protein